MPESVDRQRKYGRRHSGECRAGCCYVFGSRHPSRTYQKYGANRPGYGLICAGKFPEAPFRLFCTHGKRTGQFSALGCLFAGNPKRTEDYCRRHRRHSVRKMRLPPGRDFQKRHGTGLAYYRYRDPVYRAVARESSTSPESRPESIRTPTDLTAWYKENSEPRLQKLENTSAEQLVKTIEFRGRLQLPAVMYPHNDEPFGAPSRSIVRVFAADGRESAGDLRRKLRFGAGASGGPAGVRLTRRATRDSLTNGSKSRSEYNSSWSFSMHQVAITVSIVFRTVTPSRLSFRKFLAA